MPDDPYKFLSDRHTEAEQTTTGSMTVDELRLMIRESLKSGVAEGSSLDAAAKKLKSMFTRDKPFESGAEWDQARADAKRVLQQNFGVDDVDARIQEISDNLEKLPESTSRSPYEYWVLGVKLQAIRDTALRHTREAPLPVFDTMALGHVNALVKRVGERYVLVFQSGTKSFSNLFSRALTRVWRDLGKEFHGRPDAVSESRTRELIRSNPGTDALRSILHGYLFLGHPGAGIQIPLEGPEREFAHRLESGMDLFVVGHEYSHILHEHQDDWSKSTRDKEIEADRSGVFLMMETLRRPGEDLVLPFCGAYAILAMQETIMRTVATLNGVEFDRGQYPPVIERLVNLFASCERRGLLTPQIETTALGFGTTLGMICEIADTALQEIAATGRGLDPIWHSR